MKLLVIDGNSIINRAYYGIKLLSTKDGVYTNAVFGFLNMMKRFEDMCSPDAVAVAFDVHAPTPTRQADMQCPTSFALKCRLSKIFFIFWE